MHDLFLSVILGIIEGVTEFLPISSTAHLRIAEELMSISLKDPYWKMYTVVIQLGAILSVVVYFRKRIVEFIATFPRRGTILEMLKHPLGMTMLAFVVTAIPCYLADKKIGDNLENLTIIGGALLIGGAVMWAVDAICTQARTTSMEQMSLTQAMVVGAAQVLSAAFPGTSRSMVTIAAGQTTGMSRAAALEFSFFLSIPTMIAATVFKLISPLLKSGRDEHELVVMTGQRWLVLAVGLVVSFFVAWAVVAWFMSWVRRRGFVPFAVYRIILGILVLSLIRHG